MVDYEKLEKFSKKMEKWHNRIFPWVTRILMYCSLLISATAIASYYEYEDQLRNSWDSNNDNYVPYEVFQVLFYLGSIGIPLYMFYVLLFTKFRFPIDFKGNGRGRKNLPPPNVN